MILQPGHLQGRVGMMPRCCGCLETPAAVLGPQTGWAAAQTPQFDRFLQLNACLSGAGTSSHGTKQLWLFRFPRPLAAPGSAREYVHILRLDIAFQLSALPSDSDWRTSHFFLFRAAAWSV